MTKITKYTYMLAAVALGLTACDDNKVEYVAAEPENPNCMGVYFDADNDGDFIFIPGEEAAIHLTLHREKTDAAADVPLVCTSTVDGVVFPSTAHFDSGSSDSHITVRCDNMSVGQKAKIVVGLPEDYINHYSETLFNYETSALVSKWESANQDGSPVKFYFTSQDYATSNADPVSAVFQPIESEMEVLPGASMIRVKDFLNSGVDMTFTFTPSTFDNYAGYYRVNPYNHYMTFVDAYEDDSYGDSWFNPWFMLNGIEDEEGDEDLVTLNLTELDGTPSEFSYPYFFWYSAADAFEYSYAVFKSSSHKYNAVSMGISGTPAGTLTLPTYFYLFFRWDGPSGL